MMGSATAAGATRGAVTRDYSEDFQDYDRASGVPPYSGSSPHSLRSLSVLVVCDASTARLGLRAWLQDVGDRLQQRLETLEVLPPALEEVWQRPGQKMQRRDWDSLVPSLGNALAFKRRLAEARPGLVVVATAGVLGISAAHMARARGIPVLIAAPPALAMPKPLGWESSPIDWVAEHWQLASLKRLFRKSTVIAPAPALLERAQALGARHTRLLGTVLPSPCTTAPRPASGELHTVLYAGPLVPERNIDALLDTAKRYTGMQFTIAGDGPLRRRVERAAIHSHNLSYLGWLDRPQLSQLVDQHDALLLPSRGRSFCGMALEGMARQKLVIAASSCGAAQWEGLREHLLPIRDYQTPSDALAEALSLTSSERRKLAVGARRAALAHHEAALEDWNALLLDSMRAQAAA